MLPHMRHPYCSWPLVCVTSRRKLRFGVTAGGVQVPLKICCPVPREYRFRSLGRERYRVGPLHRASGHGRVVSIKAIVLLQIPANRERYEPRRPGDRRIRTRPVK
jgi:hypothetical protein